jgi:predicted XRE-type DNA-binding protein
MNSNTRKIERRRSDDTRVFAGGVNFFKTLGRKNADEAFAKIELAFRIHTLIQRAGLTQTEAARLLGTDRARLSNLMRGRLAEFSLERLFHFLNKLGQDIEVTIRPKRQADARVHVLAKAG